MWNLIVSVPDHAYHFTFRLPAKIAQRRRFRESTTYFKRHFKRAAVYVTLRAFRKDVRFGS